MTLISNGMLYSSENKIEPPLLTWNKLQKHTIKKRK